MKTELYYQCKLIQPLTANVTLVTIGYIEERGAIIGARVELKGEEGLWEVTTVDDKPITKLELGNVITTSRKTPDSLTNQMMKDRNKG